MPYVRCGRLSHGSSKDVPVLIPRACDSVTCHGKRDFADAIKLTILRWRDDPGLTGWWVLRIITRVLIRGRGRFGYKRGGDDVMMEAEIRMMCSEDEGRGHMRRKVGRPPEAEKDEEREPLPRASRRKQPCRFLDISSVKLISDF